MKPAGRGLLLALSCALLPACGGGDSGSRPLATFLHATDPHLFLERELALVRDTALGRDTLVEPRAARRERQEELDRAAVRALLGELRRMRPVDRPELLLFTGDWGIDTTTAVPAGAAAAPAQADTVSPPQPDTAAAPVPAPVPDRWAEQADTVAALLSLSPVKRVYWVPGNNDVAGESADPAELARTDEFTALVSQRLRNGVTLQNLTACYAGQPGSCTADVPGTRYTLVGFPSVSFKNKQAGAADTARVRQIQEQLVVQASALVEGVRARGRRAVIATHIPELDDPYERGQQLYAGKAPARPELGPSAWNVSDTVLARWKRLVESDTVAAVLAGHFHDSHREVYERPYTWAESSGLRADPHKLLLAPPLSVKNQDASPVQARGFSMIRLFADTVGRRNHWLDPATGRFAPDEAREERDAGPDRGGFLSSTFGWIPGVVTRPAGWLWSVVDETKDLARAAVWAFALLAAFLTAVAVWRIPEPLLPRTAAAPVGAVPAQAIADQQKSLGSAFEGNFARTVLSGLGGMAAVAFLDSFWDEADFDAKAYYLVLFVTFFLLFLVLYALARGFTEALRSRVATVRAAPVQTPSPTGPAGPGPGGHGPPPGGGPPGAAGASSARPEPGWLSRSWRGLRNWMVGVGRWIASLRETFLVFFDTAFSVLLGRNQSASVVWEAKIVDMQEGMVAAVERVREELTTVVREAVLRAVAKKDVESDTSTEVQEDVHNLADRLAGVEQGIRVAVTALADDGKSLFYVAKAQGSLAKPFGPESVAWIAVQSGEARWWLRSYQRRNVVLFDNTVEQIAAHKFKLMLDDYYAVRDRSDYEAFVVIPIPWRWRSLPRTLRRGAIHISFAEEEWARLLWPKLMAQLPATNGEDHVKEKVYEEWASLLTRGKLTDEPLRAVLHQSVDVLAELLARVDQSVFESRLARRRDL